MKSFLAKTYTPSGTFKNAFTRVVFSSFDDEVNGGQGGMELTIPRSFDNFSQNHDLDIGNVVKLYSISDDGTNTLLYTGIIDGYNLEVGATDTVTITCVGAIAQLSNDIYHVSKVTYKKFSSMELGAMMKNVIDTFRSNTSYPLINYSASSIANTGVTKTQELYMNTYFDAVSLIAQLAPYNYTWHVGADGILSLSANPTTATHFFTIGKEISNLSINASYGQSYNALLFSNGLGTNDPEYIYHMFTDATSISTYGRKVKTFSDNRFKKSTATYIEKANKDIAIFKDPIYTVSLTIADDDFSDKGYNIESIHVGDTFKVLNTPTTSALTSNMLITNTTYNVGSITLTATDTIQYTNRILAQINSRTQNNQFSSNLPTTYI